MEFFYYFFGNYVGVASLIGGGVTWFCLFGFERDFIIVSVGRDYGIFKIRLYFICDYKV